jgi:large subunit ribosomal protein L25
LAELFLKAEIRQGRGKGFSRRLRIRGLIPAVMYGEGEHFTLALDAKELRRALQTQAGENVLMQLQVGGDESMERTVMLRELQVDPVRGGFLHADLFRISMEKELEVEVPIELVGKPKGLATEGAVLSQLVDTLRVRCLPARIPTSILADVSGLEVGQVLHVHDLAAPPGVLFLNDPDEAVANLSVVTERVAPAEEVAALGEEGAPKVEEGRGLPEGGGREPSGKEGRGG